MDEVPYVRVDDLPAWRAHVAVRVRTMIWLPNVDARIVANSLRSSFDWGMQVVVPMGSSRVVMLQGAAASLIRMVEFLREADASAKPK